MTLTEILTTAGATATVVVPVAGVAVGYMRMYVDRAIRDLKLEMADQLKKSGDHMEETYVRRRECSLMRTDIEGRLERIEERLAAVKKRD